MFRFYVEQLKQRREEFLEVFTGVVTSEYFLEELGCFYPPLEGLAEIRPERSGRSFQNTILALPDVKIRLP